MTQAIKDAIADAETLRRHYPMKRGPFGRRVENVVEAAAMNGFRAASAMKNGLRAASYDFATDAARAAFRAVPELRS
jgi:hypothetical protein